MDYKGIVKIGIATIVANIISLVIWENYEKLLIIVPIAAHIFFLCIIYRRLFSGPAKAKPSTFVQVIPKANIEIEKLIIYGGEGNLWDLISGLNRDDRWKEEQKETILDLRRQLQPFVNHHDCHYRHIPYVLTKLRPMIKEIKDVVNNIMDCDDGYYESICVAFDRYKSIYEEIRKDANIWTTQLAKELEIP